MVDSLFSTKRWIVGFLSIQPKRHEDRCGYSKRIKEGWRCRWWWFTSSTGTVGCRPAFTAATTITTILGSTSFHRPCSTIMTQGTGDVRLKTDRGVHDGTRSPHKHARRLGIWIHGRSPRTQIGSKGRRIAQKEFKVGHLRDIPTGNVRIKEGYVLKHAIHILNLGGIPRAQIARKTSGIGKESRHVGDAGNIPSGQIRDKIAGIGKGSNHFRDRRCIPRGQLGIKGSQREHSCWIQNEQSLAKEPEIYVWWVKAMVTYNMDTAIYPQCKSPIILYSYLTIVWPKKYPNSPILVR